MTVCADLAVAAFFGKFICQLVACFACVPFDPPLSNFARALASFVFLRLSVLNQSVTACCKDVGSSVRTWAAGTDNCGAHHFSAGSGSKCRRKDRNSFFRELGQIMLTF